jgi:hypothetical protein
LAGSSATGTYWLKTNNAAAAAVGDSCVQAQALKLFLKSKSMIFYLLEI